MPKYDLTSYARGNGQWGKDQALTLERLTQNQVLPEPVRALPYSASMTPDLSGLTVAHLTVIVTNGTAFTINAPINAEPGAVVWFDILNSSGGAMGAVTWNAAYVFDAAWSSPSNGNHRVIGFYRSGASWIELAQSQAGGSGAPTTADYLVKTADAGLSAERVVTDGTSIVWDWSVAGQAKATRAALTGDVTASADANATTIAAAAVTYAKIQNVTDARLLGRSAGSAGSTQEITVGTGLSLSSGALTASPTWTVVKKASDEIRSSTVTLANDGALTVAMVSGTTYVVRGNLYLQSVNATMDYQYALAFSGTSSSSFFRARHAACGAVAGTDNETTRAATGLLGATAVTATTSGLGYVQFEVFIVCTGNGTFAIQWAQNTSDAGNLTGKEGSYLEYMTI